MRRLALALSLALAAACPPELDDDDALDDDDTSDDDDAVPLEPTWTAIQQRFEARCSCHVSQSRGGFTGLATYDRGWDVLVGAASRDLPDMPRVTPFEPENSYVWHKLNNTQDSVGGDGGRMPLTEYGLPDTDLDAIEEWILAGAPKD